MPNGPKMPTSPALSVLQPLIGSWIMRITWSEKTHRLVGGPRSVEIPGSFAWTAQGGFLVHTSGGGGAPVAHWMIGGDDTSGAFSALYADDRGVSRLYEMSFARDLWKMWRTSAGFHQRFAGQISADGNTIEAYWEKSEDGSSWERDFDLIYTKSTRASPLCRR
jgi:hypothetical protein